ncbi:cupin domain-containing protein [Pontixanthobacter sp.]|uniref:cupin domain-containing protein n=1 Tax=Pontixanthobacter sp. TaxID=2792078 RepID=UPI003C7E63F8
MKLSQFDPADFLANFWQKKPAVIRNAWTEWVNPADANDIAGLACEPAVESRLIEHIGTGLALTHGPMQPQQLQELGPNAWTLLVQAADQFIPEIAALVQPFRFIPDWRIDDVMVSLANHGGGVGPHFDQYDVFLIQGAGLRKWQIGQNCDRDSAVLPHDDLLLLADFKVRDEWVLEPGDMLYVPPGIAHNGVAASDNCMTYSVGFRAPSVSEMLADYADDVLLRMTGDARYADPDLAIQTNPGEILPQALQRMQAMVLEQLNDPHEFARWAGAYTTASKYPDIDWSPQEPLTRSMLKGKLALGHVLRCNPAFRFAFTRAAKNTLYLHVNGQSHFCEGGAARLAEQLCLDHLLELPAADMADEATMDVLAALYNDGALEWAEAG